ncbi:hypothetical protein [Selenomonas noxia]|jgi:hypothetical protein|uniref:hypothetical protein n=1 Tax=Selenomonas noxia TaxID=135083 RepID=UPI0028D37264|nr:hypothetical protein [Selenomonas noxia]
MKKILIVYLFAIVYFASFTTTQATIQAHRIQLDGLRMDTTLEEIKDKYGRPDYVDSSAAGYTRWNWDSGLSILHRRYKFLTATATKPGLVTFDDVSVGDPAYRLTDVYGTADKVFTDSQYDSYYYYNEKGVGYLSFSVSKLTGDIVEIHMDRTSV